MGGQHAGARCRRHQYHIPRQAQILRAPAMCSSTIGRRLRTLGKGRAAGLSITSRRKPRSSSCRSSSDGSACPEALAVRRHDNVARIQLDSPAGLLRYASRASICSAIDSYLVAISSMVFAAIVSIISPEIARASPARRRQCFGSSMSLDIGLT